MRVCAYPDCDRPGEYRNNRPSRGKWCSMHKSRRIRGVSMDMTYNQKPKQPWPGRFWAKVDRKSNDECWPWLASRNDGGYGQIMIDSRPHRAHRVCYELLRGEIPEGLVADHLCRNRWCVNPWHLEIVTNAENIRRGDHAWSPERFQSHCPSGHGYTEENTRMDPSGHRRCRTCEREQSIAGYCRRKERESAEKAIA